jgi:hypothetical protein
MKSAGGREAGGVLSGAFKLQKDNYIVYLFLNNFYYD